MQEQRIYNLSQLKCILVKINIEDTEITQSICILWDDLR